MAALLLGSSSGPASMGNAQLWHILATSELAEGNRTSATSSGMGVANPPNRVGERTRDGSPERSTDGGGGGGGRAKSSPDPGQFQAGSSRSGDPRPERLPSPSSTATEEATGRAGAQAPREGEAGCDDTSTSSASGVSATPNHGSFGDSALRRDPDDSFSGRRSGDSMSACPAQVRTSYSCCWSSSCCCRGCCRCCLETAASCCESRSGKASSPTLDTEMASQMESTDGLLFHLGMPAARFAHAAAASAASGSLENMVCGLMHCPLCILAPTPSLPPQLLLSRNPSKGAPRICSGRTRGSQDAALSCARVPVATDDAGNTPESRRRGLPPPKPPPPPLWPSKSSESSCASEAVRLDAGPPPTASVRSPLPSPGPGSSSEGSGRNEPVKFDAAGTK
mmetsp:Transcript_73910/g.199202  ORF Transcript_73910/g.199202 Transcript_73910/m.199202 type:complete len:395 (+) Transcript_73910:247-1431(+)